jgi:hypothetical protein
MQETVVTVLYIEILYRPRMADNQRNSNNLRPSSNHARSLAPAVTRTVSRDIFDFLPVRTLYKINTGGYSKLYSMSPGKKKVPF